MASFEGNFWERQLNRRKKMDNYKEKEERGEVPKFFKYFLIGLLGLVAYSLLSLWIKSR